MTAVSSRSKSGERKKPASKAGSGGPRFSNREYKDFLDSRSRLHNDVSRENRNTSIFDAMKAVDSEFEKKIYDGMSIADMFNNLR